MKNELDLIGKNIKESLLREVQENNKQIKEKLNRVIDQGPTYADTVRNEDDPSANQIKPAETRDLRYIMREERNRELAEQSEKRRRTCNIVIHGVNVAVGVEKNDGKKQDETYVQVGTQIGKARPC